MAQTVCGPKVLYADPELSRSSGMCKTFAARLRFNISWHKICLG